MRRGPPLCFHYPMPHSHWPISRFHSPMPRCHRPMPFLHGPYHTPSVLSPPRLTLESARIIHPSCYTIVHIMLFMTCIALSVPHITRTLPHATRSHPHTTPLLSLLASPFHASSNHALFRPVKLISYSHGMQYIVSILKDQG